MTMSNRQGMPHSGEAVVASGDGTTPQTVVDSRDTAVFEPNQIIIECDPGGTYSNLELTFHDDPDGTGGGNLSTAIKTVEALNPGDVRSYDDLMMRDIQADLLVQTDGNQDADIEVYADGKEVTDAPR